jgi:hypothetical protein
MKLIARVLDRFWPICRWQCATCMKVWEQRRDPSYTPHYFCRPSWTTTIVPPLHDIDKRVLKDGWLVGGFVACGPVRYVATRVRPRMLASGRGTPREVDEQLASTGALR